MADLATVPLRPVAWCFERDCLLRASRSKRELTPGNSDDAEGGDR